MIRFLTAALAVALFTSATRADLAEGNWCLAQQFSSTAEQGVVVFKLEKKDGKLAATLVNPKERPIKIGEIKVDGANVTIPFDFGRPFTFEGKIDPKDAKVVRGCLFNDQATIRVILAAQDGDGLERPKLKIPEPIEAAQKMLTDIGRMQQKARQVKDANEKAELLANIKEAQKKADAAIPPLYRKVIADIPESPFASDAAGSLIRMAGKAGAKADEVATWIKIVETDAARHGDRILKTSLQGIAETLVGQKEVASAALPLAERIVKDLKEKDPLATQSKALKLLAAAQKAAGKTDAAIETRIAKVEKDLDVEYKKTVPPFKPTKFAGRKEAGANRVAVLELFTGAQCPPCVAADVAFDALESAYDSKDLILIQYHMHIPGPDPLTNPASIARWDYYQEKFPMAVGGTPTTLFNGKPSAGGGGGMPQAKGKFDQFSKVIDSILEEKTELKIGGSAKLAGEKVTVAVELDGVADPSANVRLHVLLVEEEIKYVGGNNLRFHHQVVRALPGGSAGTEVKEKSLKKSVEIDLAEVKKGLAKYLDEYAANERPFPSTDRPMDLKHLKAIVLVQNNESGEILNAAQFEVK